jgi:anti-sigma B factor antagonist
MKLSYEDHAVITVLTVSGDLTADQADGFRRACQERFEAGIRDIVLDMEHLTLLDSAGLELLLWLIDELGDHSGRLRLVNPDETVRKILQITRLERRFDIHETIEAAAKSLR